MAKLDERWGYIRETREKAEKASLDKVTGLHRTGLEDYLEAIYPETKDWIHNKNIQVEINGAICNRRPDYRSESLRLIVEFDGLPHYQNPEQIVRDEENTKAYIDAGYRVVRIPYFIQLTKQAILELFEEAVNEEFFNPSIPSIGSLIRNTPAYLCPAGVQRMAREFLRFPDQYAVNLKALEEEENPELSGVEFLKAAYDK